VLHCTSGCVWGITRTNDQPDNASTSDTFCEPVDTRATGQMQMSISLSLWMAFAEPVCMCAGVRTPVGRPVSVCHWEPQRPQQDPDSWRGQWPKPHHTSANRHAYLWGYSGVYCVQQALQEAPGVLKMPSDMFTATHTIQVWAVPCARLWQ
jgi:hypothetical protein